MNKYVVSVSGDIVYIITEVKNIRNISPKFARNANEVVIFGFNKRKNQDLFNKYVIKRSDIKDGK